MAILAARKKALRFEWPIVAWKVLLPTWSNGAIAYANQRSTTNDIPKKNTAYTQFNPTGSGILREIQFQDSMLDFGQLNSWLYGRSIGNKIQKTEIPVWVLWILKHAINNSLPYNYGFWNLDFFAESHSTTELS